MRKQRTNGRPPRDVRADGTLDGKRISARLPVALDAEIDRLVDQGHAQTRAHLVREALRDYLDAHPASDYACDPPTATDTAAGGDTE